MYKKNDNDEWMHQKGTVQRREGYVDVVKTLKE